MVLLSLPMSDPWPGFQASRWFVSDSWAFLFSSAFAVGGSFVSQLSISQLVIYSYFSTVGCGLQNVTWSWPGDNRRCSMTSSTTSWHTHVSRFPVLLMRPERLLTVDELFDHSSFVWRAWAARSLKNRSIKRWDESREPWCCRCCSCVAAASHTIQVLRQSRLL